MTWIINLLLPTAIGLTPLKGPFLISKNILLQDWHQLTHIFNYICGTDCYHKRNLLYISFEHQDNIHNYLLWHTIMAWWITTKHIFLRQDAKSLHTRSHPTGVLGHPIVSTATLWAQSCNITDVKMSTFQPRLANE
jgi:hypothetical protein